MTPFQPVATPVDEAALDRAVRKFDLLLCWARRTPMINLLAFVADVRPAIIFEYHLEVAAGSLTAANGLHAP